MSRALPWQDQPARDGPLRRKFLSAPNLARRPHAHAPAHRSDLPSFYLDGRSKDCQRGRQRAAGRAAMLEEVMSARPSASAEAAASANDVMGSDPAAVSDQARDRAAKLGL